MNRADLHQFFGLLKRLRDAIATTGEATVQAIAENTKATKEAAEQAPPEPLSRITVDIEVPSKETDRYYTEHGKTHRLQWWTFWATVATFVAVAVYAVITYLQWRTMDTTYCEIKKQTTAAVIAANASARSSATAIEALNNSRIQFEIDERPYLVKEYIRLGSKPTVGQKLIGEVFWKNTGRTPAIHALSYLQIDVLEKEPSGPTQWARLAKLQQSQIEIGSALARSIPVTGDNVLSDAWFKKLSGETYHIYIFGAVVYVDIFSKWHESYVCARYDPGSVNELYLWACKGEGTNDIK